MPSLLQLFTFATFGTAQTLISQLRNQTYKQALLATVNTTSHAKTCDDCYDILRVLKSVAELGEAPFAELSIAFCNAAHEGDPDVCAGLETLEAPSVS
ncbi:hypothetical protein LTR86_003386 [Recurvomyces mirabilis]|nr:hypothetical protein LTR86_003386 [Recurvomyces mirabilis]